jgi:thiol-disulfide isomerase/thioredoxin
MNIGKAMIIIAIGLLVCRDVAAQTEAKPNTLPQSVMNAEIASVDGSSRFRLADHDGKVLVLYIWASWCGPCRLAAPAINDFNKEYAARGVKVIGLVVGDPKSEAESTRSFTQEFEHNFVSGWIDKATASTVIGDRKIIPQILVTTGSGYLFTRMIGYNQEQTPRILRETIEEALVNLYLIK